MMFARSPLWLAVTTAALITLAPAATAQVSLATVGTPVTQSFDALASTGSALAFTGNTTLPGWYSTRPTYNTGSGSSNAGALYSFGSAADRALGSVASGGTGTIFNAVQLRNNTGAALTGLSISYVGEQWRNGGAGNPAQLTVEVQVAPVGTIVGANEPTTGWTAVPALTFTSPIAVGAAAALDGNLPANQQNVSASVPLSVPAGAEVWVRFVDVDDTGGDHGLAVDSLSITPEGPPPLPSLSIDDVSLMEGNAAATQFRFTATLSAPAPAPVTFTATTADGTATVADNDYTPLLNAPFSIATGQTSAFVDVSIVGDTANEPNETFTVTLGSLSGAQAGTLTGTGTILNDDGVTPINLSVSNPVATEGDSGTSAMTFVVSLDAPAGPGGLTFDIATQPGTALAGVDYQTRSLTAQTIAAGATSFNFAVQIVGDIVREMPVTENFAVVVSNVSGNAGGSVSNGSGTITDNDPAPLSIAQIQGTGLASPVSGPQVTLGNVVTALINNGFVMQMQTPDGDPFTSDAILVFTGGAPTVAVGDVVDLKGNLVEFNGLTEFTVTGGGLTIIPMGTAPLPPPIVLDFAIPSPLPDMLTCVGAGSTIPGSASAEEKNFECLEFMRVSTTTGVINSPAQSFTGDANAEVFFATGNARVRREAGIDPAVITEPGLPATVARFDGNPELFEFDVDRLGLPNDVLVAGTKITAVGVLGYDFGDYEFWPSSYTVNGTAAVLPRPVTAASAGQFTVGSFNVENLFDTIDDPLTEDTVLTPAELALKLGKLSSYIRTVLRAPNVLGLIEVENQTALNALIARISADDPTIVYSGMIIDGNDPRGIDNAVLYRNITFTSATALRAQQSTTQCSGAPPCLLNDRPSLLVRGSFAGAEGALPFAVIINHFRSLRGIDNQSDLNNANRVRRKRLEQAVGVAEEIQALQTAEPTLPLIVIGDFNAFEFTDGYADVTGILRGNANVGNDALPRDTLFEIGDLYPAIQGNIVNPPLFEGLADLPADERYSFLFGCSFSAGCFAQALDHALFNAPARSRLRRMEFGRGNADARRSEATVADSPLRSADHDGFVLTFDTTDRVFRNGFEGSN